MGRMEIWIGRANTGKSARVLEKIRALGDSGGGQLLLVPEHATYQAELDLCRVCGDGASRHGEVLSFRLLASRVLARTGGAADGTLDAGGKLLMMQRALREALPSLTVYARPSRKAPFLAELVALCDELQACQVGPERLGEVWGSLEGATGEKIRDLSLIYAAYLHRLHGEGRDRRDLMTRLVEGLAPSGYADGKDVFLDGFAYFTAQELAVVAILLRRARSVTITLLGERDSELEIFRQSLRARDRLVRLAGREGAECRMVYLPSQAPRTALEHLEANFFGGGGKWDGDCQAITLYRADSLFSEAEYVAAQILALVRTGRYRFRDIAVAARDLEEYAPVIESVFERFGVPVYVSRRSDVLEKPVLSLIAGALDAVCGGYEYEDMFRYLKTGLAGLTADERDRLENYVIAWDIHGAMWVREEPWTANPAGWKEGFSPEETEALAEINALREKVGGPLGRLARGLRERREAAGKLEALWEFLTEIDLPGRLEERTAELETLGELQRAREYSQLWELLCSVMDQFAETLGDADLDGEEFARLFQLVLTQYDVGTIPVSLDQVQLSQITRNDRHQVRCLFLMGANDHVLPAAPAAPGLLTREDRSRLLDQGVELAPSGVDLLDMELQNLYAALAQPTDALTISWPAAGLDGGPLRPSFVVGRARSLLPGVREESEGADRPFRLAAPIPALEAAGSCRGSALWRHFQDRGDSAPALAAMERAAGMGRGRLSPQAVETLYGRSYRMSASRIDKVNACHFAYFMQYGLRARERAPAGFDAAQVGTFLHYVLEHVTREAMDRGGFAALDEGQRRALVRRVIERYMAAAIPGFEGRERRFQYLFRRLGRTVTAIVDNVAEELADSDFRPLAFELDFSEGGDLPAISLHAPGGDLTVVGKVDRVDGWVRDGKLYIRVVDYKSGKKAFDLSDIQHGLNIQMLLYLFTLQREGRDLFGGREIVPAGVLYLPARDVLVSAPRGVDPERLRAALDKELRRSGLVLSQPEVLRAMEHSALSEPRFLPLALGRDGGVVKGVATAEELGKLGRYVDRLLAKIARELSEGNIDADPCGRGEGDSACTYCAFASACHFMQGDEGDHMELIRPVSREEFWRHVDREIGEEERT